MFKIAILGCENSHANNFLAQIYEEKLYDDVEVVGVYSNEPAAAEKLKERFGVAVADSPDAFVGKIDGLVITARDGIYHYPYAKPYIASGIPMFIDKPITSDDDEAVRFMKDLKENGVRVSGGSSCVFAEDLRVLLESMKNEEDGRILGGCLRAPLLSKSPYGGFYFYAQHLVQIAEKVFGYYPETVSASRKGDTVTVIFGYSDFDVVGLFTENCFSTYSVTIHKEKTALHSTVKIGPEAFCREFKAFYDLLCGKEQRHSYRDFIAPVFVMTAIDRALKSHATEKISYCEEI